MANTKSAKTTKSVVEKIETEEKPVAEEVKPKTKTFSPDDGIECVSVTSGELIIIGKKTGNVYRWTNHGDTTTVEFQDLRVEARNAKSRPLYDPLIMIEDEDVLALPEFENVESSYKNAISIEEIDQFFDLPLQQFKTKLKSLPKGIKNTIKSIARDKLEAGELDSIQKIKVIDEILDTELYDLLANG